MEEEDNTSTHNADSSLEDSVNLAEGSDFCLLNEDDIEMEDTEGGISVQSSEDIQQTSKNQFSREFSTALDVETMKRKADEIASSLRKFKSNRTSDSNVPLQDYEPPEELKRFRERSAFVAQKLKEDRLLFEESKKRNEAVVDKVRTVKQLHKSISESTKELKRDDPGADEIMALKLKIERLEASLSHSQSTLASKNQILFENKETIRTLTETVNETRTAYLDYVENSREEIQQLRAEHVKALEKIANSRDEFQNQLQTVRKRYLLMENDLKLSEFARFKLVSRNAELRERICQLETELQIPHSKSMSLEDIDGEKSDISLSNQTIAAIDLCPKLECLATITNEFCSYLVDLGNCDFEDDILPDNSDPLQSMDEVSDRLESVFYVVRDKLSVFSDLEENTKRTEEKLRQLEATIEENKSQDAKLKKILATMKAKIQSETNINKDLTEQLSKAHAKIQHLEQSSEQDWIFKCDELEGTNERLQHELNILQNALTAKEPSPQMLETVDHLKRELEAKIRECERLRLTCEELEDTNDKLENDFVVLRARDCDEEEHWKITCAQLQDENGKLMENTRLLTERAMEYENERLSLYQQVDELRQSVNDLTNQLETVNKQLIALQDAKIEHDSDLEAVIDNLTAEYNILSRKMNDAQKQLEYESSSSQDSRQLVQLAENTNARLSHEIHDLQKRNQELEAVKMSLESRIVELEGRLETFENEKVDLLKNEQYFKDVIVDYQRASHERDDELEYLKQHNVSLAPQVESLKAKLEVLEGECATYALKAQTEQSNHEALVRANEELTSSVRQLRQTISDLEDEKAAHVESLRAEKDECATYMLKAQADEVNQEALARANEELTSSVRQLRKNISDLEHEKRQLVCHYEAQFANDSSSLRELESLKSHNQELLDKCAQYCDRVALLENERSNLQNDGELQTRITSLEAENQLLVTECEKFKNKYQRLQLLCKANINKAVSEAKAEVEKYKTAWLEATNQQHREGAIPAATAQEWKNAYMTVQEECAKAEDRKIELESQKEALSLELESWKGKYDEVFCTLCAAQQEIHGLKQLVTEYEAELLKKVHESPVLSKRPPSRTDDNQLLDMESTVDVVVSECLRRTDEDVQRAVDEVVNECLQQTDELHNCINELKSENQRLREQHKEMELCQMRVGQLQEELRSVRLDYNNLEQRLYNMDEESENEITRYEELLTKANANLKSAEESLAETRSLLQHKESEYVQCRYQLQELTDSERLMQQHRTSDMINAAAQTDSEEGAEQPASIASYFDYYKGKITKEITNVLQPEEQSVDFSNWILPESQDKEYQMRYQQVPSFGYEASEESTPAASLDKGSQTLVMNQDQASQAEIASLHQLGQNLDPTMKSGHQTREKQSPSEVVDQLRELLLSKMNGDEWLIGEGEWSSADLDVYNENFVNTSFKFVDLCEAIIQFYSAIPQANVMLDKLKKLFNPPAPEREDSSAEWNHQDSYYQLITLCTQLECENKYLVDAVTYVEDTVLIIRPTVEITRFHDVMECWRTDRNFEETDIIDRVCEEFDIVPSKFAAGSLFATWKETMLKSLENLAPVLPTPSQAAAVSSYYTIEPSLVSVMKKNHKLIGDLYYKYGVDKNFDPNEFFEQIDDINVDVERLVKFVKGEIEELPPVEVEVIHVHSHAHDHHDHEQHDHNHDDHDHKHDHHHHDHEHEHDTHHGHEHEHDARHDHEHEHDAHHGHEHEHDAHHGHEHEHDAHHGHEHDRENALKDHHHEHDAHHGHEHDRENAPKDHHHDHHHHPPAHHGRSENEAKVQDSKAVEELKQLLAESNKKIDSLVRELMEAKNSKDYNEMKQLHAKLDETLYHLHLSDVHNAELTQELTQLLSERDALQLKLSSVIRQYEELRQAFVSANKSSDDSVPLPNVSERLEELQKVNYMKDPRISEASSKYHPSGIYAEDSAETAHRVKDESASGFSLFKWITGDTDSK